MSYNLARDIMPTAAIIMQNSKSTFGVLPGAFANGTTTNGKTNNAYADSEL